MLQAAVLLFIALTVTTLSAEPAFEKVRDKSPDGRFALRISCDSEPEDREKIDSSYIAAIDLVSLPDKKKVAQLLSEDDVGTTFGEVTLIWSSDSKWCAFYHSAPRVGYTAVYRLSGGEFKPMNKPENLLASVKGDVRNEYVRPIKWIKPGLLQLEQFSIFRGGESETRLQLIAGIAAKDTFKVLSKKKLPSE
jgi:hypothetical protein